MLPYSRHCTKSGGVLKYGIPEFRLPNKIVDVEIENLAQMGVKFIKDCIIGKTLSVEQLEEEGFKGIFVASGAGLPNFMTSPVKTPSIFYRPTNT